MSKDSTDKLKELFDQLPPDLKEELTKLIAGPIIDESMDWFMKMMRTALDKSKEDKNAAPRTVMCFGSAYYTMLLIFEKVGRKDLLENCDRTAITVAQKIADSMPLDLLEKIRKAHKELPCIYCLEAKHEECLGPSGIACACWERGHR